MVLLLAVIPRVEVPTSTVDME
uniref:Uncharacterized protein n=1 Tax=Anguilla anguilla TaxID=7936 RepID=A0A0E9VCQ0_ANGAN